MNKRVLTLLLAAVAVIVCLAGCSPTIGMWADRGEIGCDHEQTAADAWRDLTLEYIAVQHKASVADVFTDIRAVTGSKVIGLDGKPVVLDDAWLNEAHLALEATLAGLTKRRATVDEMHARHTANIAATRESFAQIRRLNTAWASLGGFSQSDLPAQVGRLVEELRRQRTEK